MSTEWMCLGCYERLCKKEKKEFEIKSLPNFFKNPCIVCGDLAVYLVSGIRLKEGE